jgi:succinate dehydrogenase / fumarate reductase membrane anchor subunit
MSQEAASALSKFLGRGSAHEGEHHWRAQRVSALALAPLVVWFVMAMACQPDYSFATLHAWLAVPWRTLAMSLLVFCIAWHSQLGVQVVIEDYVYGRVIKPLSLLLNNFAHVVVGGAGVLAILRVAFQG